MAEVPCFDEEEHDKDEEAAPEEETAANKKEEETAAETGAAGEGGGGGAPDVGVNMFGTGRAEELDLVAAEDEDEGDAPAVDRTNLCNLCDLVRMVKQMFCRGHNNAVRILRKQTKSKPNPKEALFRG